MARKHHEKVNTAENDEHPADAEFVLKEFHNRGGNGFGQTEAHDGDTSCQTFVIFKPEHEGFDGRQISDTETDSHDASVE